jgi:MFS family permease
LSYDKSAGIASGGRLQQTFSALQSRNFRLWFIGQIVSLFGTWMQSTAQGILIYQLTQSPVFLGYVGFAAGLPSWIFMLYGGYVADRMSRRTLMVITQTAMMILAFILAALAFLNIVQPWQILVLTFLLGIANAFDAPARLALTPELVEPQDLTNAIALNATMFNTATVLGPALAGIFYAWLGPGWCFTINGLSFLAVIAALLMMRLPPFVQTTRRVSPLVAIREGFSYVRTHTLIKALILTIGAVSLFGLAFINLIPAWADTVLHGGATTTGLLQAARGTGALVGSLVIASLGSFRYRGRLLTFGLFAMPVSLLIFSWVTMTVPSLLAMVGIGVASIFVMNLANAAVQTATDDALRGRVMSIYSLIFFGAMPFGAVLIGWLAELTSEQIAVRLGAIALLAFAAWLTLTYPHLRRIE